MEFFLTPGAHSDTKALQHYASDLPENANIREDKAYNDYGYEDLLQDVGVKKLQTSPQSHRDVLDVHRSSGGGNHRQLDRMVAPRHIRSVTAAGFELKVGLCPLL
ncbi:MAG: hypothetical protein WA970_11750 [Gammaproteobacteria bacterium]